MATHESHLALILYAGAVIAMGCILIVATLIAPDPDYSNRLPASPYAINHVQ
ncbi:hypothetical protein GGD50_002122 [Rhizobium paranaense]|uniref:Uncharacterized protein n=1 Tax=Rhizobium paranaense TaxID=1650438 RepID=A0A7W8XQ19_9HYPH|nr:hypothetical protein [Rhizobium paranaense]